MGGELALSIALHGFAGHDLCTLVAADMDEGLGTAGEYVGGGHCTDRSL